MSFSLNETGAFCHELLSSEAVLICELQPLIYKSDSFDIRVVLFQNETLSIVSYVLKLSVFSVNDTFNGFDFRVRRAM